MLKTLSLAGGTTAIGVGGLVLFGWAFHIQWLKSLLPSFATMKPNTALAFILLGLALRFQLAGVGRRRGLSPFLSGAAALLGALVLSEWVSGWNLGIDQMLLRDDGPTAGRMSPMTAVNIVLLGSSLFLDSWPANRRWRFSGGLALLVGITSLLAILGYLYGVRSLYSMSLYVSMALHTALTFFILSLSILFAHPEKGIGRHLAGDGPGGTLARRMIPAVILIPAIVGFVRLKGQEAGLYDTQFGLALYATSNIILLTALTWWTAHGLWRVERERKKAQAAVEESREDLDITLNSIGDAVIATDAKGRVVRMNPVAEKMTGWTLGEARNRLLGEVFHILNERTRQAVENPVERVLREGIVIGLANHTVLLHRDGTEMPIADSGAPIQDAQGLIRGVVMVFRDLTENQKIEDELMKSQGRFAKLAESGIIGIVITDKSGLLLDANPGFLKIVGYSMANLLDARLRISDLTAPEWREPSSLPIHQIQENGFMEPWEKEYLRKDGSRVPVLVGGTAIDGATNIRFVVDLSERRDAEESKVRQDRAEKTLQQTELQLRQSQKMDAVGRLAGGVAHDFNNVLSVILSYSQMLLDDMKPGNPDQEYMEEIQKAGHRAADLTRQLLMFSRQQILSPKVLDLNDTLANMDKMLQRLVGEDVEMKILPGNSTGRVRVDPGSIEQVVMNLAVNARDAMPKGGKLTLEILNVSLDQAYAQEHLGVVPGPYVMLAVSDNGMGMDKETQNRIFEPFFTTKEVGKGTGLGLSTVFGIVQQSGGHIAVYSEPGKGTTFKVYLPQVDAKLETVQTVVHTSAFRGTETILLVEDEDQVRSVAFGILRRNGYQVIEARNAGEALLLCEKHADPIHLLLSDVVMPQMSGPELAKRLAQVRPDMKILCMSGYTDDAVLRHGLVESGLAFLQKPFTSETLPRKVRAVLDT
jgi:two-component system, cell cycle sensor histidine kinase and response regulator CckA